MYEAVSECAPVENWYLYVQIWQIWQWCQTRQSRGLTVRWAGDVRWRASTSRTSEARVSECKDARAIAQARGVAERSEEECIVWASESHETHEWNELCREWRASEVSEWSGGVCLRSKPAEGRCDNHLNRWP